LTDATEFNDRTGVYIASPGVKFNQQYDLMPVFAKADRDLQKFGDVLFDLVHPMWLLRILSNNVLAYVGIEHQFKGPNQNIPNHGVSGTQAILEAVNAIEANQMDRAIIVGYESAVEPQAQSYYASIGTLAKESIRPFNADRDGTVLAEAGSALFIETLESAKARGAKIYAEILAGSIVSEAIGIFPISDDAEGLQRALQQTLTKANLNADDIGMVSAHANGTVNSDATEAFAINKIFGNQIPVTGFKWSLGHGIAAAGILETIFTIKSLNENIVPGIKTLTNLAPECASINVKSEHQVLKKPTAINITRGFSGLQGCLLLQL
jgi:3-oxoacyl-[acyl-carrier-protein] synthase-1